MSCGCDRSSSKIAINRAEFRKKVYGCWLGKAVGGTLGMPCEGRPGPLSLTYFDPVPTQPVPNDDLDLQLMWLMLLRNHNMSMSLAQMGRGWWSHCDFPWDEYGIAWSNFSRNIFAPASGHHGNLCGDCMGSPIRSELWATLAAGDPELAAKFAYYDAIQDHDGEGVWGEVFFATIESAAYVISDRDQLIQLGLSVIPKESRTYQAVSATLKWYAEDRDWKRVRERILEKFGHENFTDGPQNFAFTILGWLHGKSFGECICTAANCGQDTDCTAATLGSILGIIDPDSITAEWRKPVSEVLKVSAAIKNIDLPKTLDELTDLSVEAADQMLKRNSQSVSLCDAATTPNVAFPKLACVSRYDSNTIVLMEKNLAIALHYPDGIDFVPGQPTRLSVKFENRSGAEIAATPMLEFPMGWTLDKTLTPLKLAPGVSQTFDVKIVPAKETRVHTVAATLAVESNGVRAEYVVPFISHWHWTLSVNGSEKQIWLRERMIEQTGEMKFPVGTRVKLSAMLHFSRNQNIRAVLAYHGAATLTIDGQKRIDCPKGWFLPFPHRPVDETRTDLFIREGLHHIEVEFVANETHSPIALVFADGQSYHIMYDITFQ